MTTAYYVIEKTLYNTIVPILTVHFPWFTTCHTKDQALYKVIQFNPRSTPRHKGREIPPVSDDFRFSSQIISVTFVGSILSRWFLIVPVWRFFMIPNVIYGTS